MCNVCSMTMATRLLNATRKVDDVSANYRPSNANSIFIHDVCSQQPSSLVRMLWIEAQNDHKVHSILELKNRSFPFCECKRITHHSSFKWIHDGDPFSLWNGAIKLSKWQRRAWPMIARNRLKMKKNDGDATAAACSVRTIACKRCTKFELQMSKVSNNRLNSIHSNFAIYLRRQKLSARHIIHSSRKSNDWSVSPWVLN